MDNKLQKKKSEEKDSSLGTILFSSLAITLLFIVELYLMIAMPQMLPAIAAVGVAIVGCTYLDLATFIKRLRKKEQQQQEQYDSILKSEKASYLLIRKYFDEIEEQMSMLEDKFSEPFQEVIAAQKATAKVTINRNKENTDALMNSNDKLLDLVFQMEGKLEELSGDISTELAENAKGKNAELMQKQAETFAQMSNQIRELELGLRNEILQAVNKLSTISPQVVMAPPQMMPMQQTMATPVSMPKEPVADLGSLGNTEELGDLPDFAPLGAVETDTLEEESMAGLDFMSEAAPVEDEKPEVEELDDIEELDIEELPPMEDLSSSDEAMSSDDIDALLASMAADVASAEELPDVVAEEVLEPEPEPEPQIEPVEEEKPPMPDLSDPNRSMSPEEIAALFANLG